jgi:hypothetical protein
MKIKLSKSQIRKKGLGFCIEKGCTAKHAPNRNVCYKHMVHSYKLRNPEKYKINYLKQNLKKTTKP